MLLSFRPPSLGYIKIFRPSTTTPPYSSAGPIPPAASLLSEFTRPGALRLTLLSPVSVCWPRSDTEPHSPWHSIWDSALLVDAADLQHSSKHPRQHVCSCEVSMGGQSSSTREGLSERERIETTRQPSIIATAVSYCCCVPLIVIFLNTTSKRAMFFPSTYSMLLKPL